LSSTEKQRLYAELKQRTESYYAKHPGAELKHLLP
jgi:hypothetical protein